MNKFQSNRTSMEAFLRQFAGREILYHPNPGNGGDGLIAQGTYDAFRRCGIKFKLIDLEADVTGKIVFLAGGGNLVPLYWDIHKAYKKFFGRAARIILLPHTIRGHDELLAELDETCTIFCRDMESFIHVTKVNLRSEVYTEHDMACHVDAAEFIADPDNVAKCLSTVLDKFTSKNIDIANMPTVGFFRSDWESARSVQTSDMDISHEFSFGVWPDNARKSAWCMLKAVSLAKFVETDRLHVAVSCALMDVPCTLFDNSYGKNGGIYRYSLRNRTPAIKFKEFAAAERGLHHAAF